MDCFQSRWSPIVLWAVDDRKRMDRSRQHWAVQNFQAESAKALGALPPGII